MPPNLIFRKALVRGELVNYTKRYTKNEIVRTDFILENVFALLLKPYRNFYATNAMNEEETKTWKCMEKLIYDFREHCANAFKGLCMEIDIVNEDTIGSILIGVSNELFSEGITWSRIIAFFVFVGELITICICKNQPESIVDVIYECFSRLMKEKLEMWIDDHDGWGGINNLFVVAPEKKNH